jgi:hypothetical protein
MGLDDCIDLGSALYRKDWFYYFLNCSLQFFRFLLVATLHRQVTRLTCSCLSCDDLCSDPKTLHRLHKFQSIALLKKAAIQIFSGLVLGNVVRTDLCAGRGAAPGAALAERFLPAIPF